jgi:protein-S-isoprenylcysteine O-methyltransferase Ste14
MGLFGSAGLPAAQAGDPAWVGVGFIRVSGAALAALGLITLAASRLKGEAARVIGGAVAAGLALLGVVTLIQAQAIWNTPSGWVLTVVVLLGSVGAIILRFSARQTVAH